MMLIISTNTTFVVWAQVAEHLSSFKIFTWSPAWTSAHKTCAKCSNITAGQVIGVTEAWPERWHWPPSSHGSGVWVETYFVHGQMHRPQHLAMSVRFFSASFMSLLIWSRPSSMRSSCSAHAREMGKSIWGGGRGNMQACTKTHTKGTYFHMYGIIYGCMYICLKGRVNNKTRRTHGLYSHILYH